MAKLNDTGVYKLKGGNWAYRYTITTNGQKKDVRKAKDENGNPFTSKRDAVKARATAIEREQASQKPKEIERKTVAEVYAEYCEKGREGKAYTTIRKQDSLWKNHLCFRFGKCCVADISVADVNDYLTELYYKKKLSYRYVEGFLKMFYLIFGQAYSRDYLDRDSYNKLCVNKDTKIRMPKLKNDDDTDIVAFEPEELLLLDKYFKGTNAETAYLLGKLCGLRINECFGLRWQNVDLEKGTILIDRQMQYQEGLIKLVPPKTKKANRLIYMNADLLAYFRELAQKREQDEITFARLREQNRRLIEDMDGSNIYSTDLVNCLPNGKIQTVNSFKYPSREIKQKYGINFRFHHLRHTYGTRMAEMNTPPHLLCNQMGHANIQITQRYYIAISRSGVDVLKNNLNRL